MRLRGCSGKRQGSSKVGIQDELDFIMRDFNAHVGIIGEQELNYNGKIVLDIMTENNMIMLNDTDKCKGTYTWSRGQNKSVVYLVSVNSLAFGICDQMEIDEQQEQFDFWLQTTPPTSGGAVTANSSCCANCVEPPRPQQWGPIYRFLGMPAMRTRWMAGAVVHQSG